MLIITCTSGRPKALEALIKFSISAQTLDDYEHLIVCDDPDGYRFPKDKKTKVIKREHDPNGPPSICQNYGASLDYFEQSSHQKAVFFEDDDAYVQSYLRETTKQLDRADLFGWSMDAYYWVMWRRAKRWLNVGYAALASTGITRNALSWAKECVQQGKPQIDLALWFGYQASNGQLKHFHGKRLLADNFSGFDENSPMPKKIDRKTGLAIEYPRHVGLKSPWHGGLQHASDIGMQPHGGVDHDGSTLRKWLSPEAASYFLSFTRTPKPDDAAFSVVPYMSAEDELGG